MVILTLPLSSYPELAFAFRVRHKMQNVAVMQINNLRKSVPSMPRFLVRKIVFHIQKFLLNFLNFNFFLLGLHSSRKSNPGIVVNPKCTNLCFLKLLQFFSQYLWTSVWNQMKRNFDVIKLFASWNSFPVSSCTSTVQLHRNSCPNTSHHLPCWSLMNAYLWLIHGGGGKRNWFIHDSLVLLLAPWCR